VAVRAQDTDVLDPVVGRISIYVVELERNGLPTPRRETAVLTERALDSGANQPRLEIVTLMPYTHLEELLEWAAGPIGASRSSAPRLPDEVACIELEFADLSFQRAVVASGRH
jgi:hypothetical protein